MKAGSVKHLEAVLQLSVPVEPARALTKVLVGINQLRQADAHLPSSEFAQAFDLVGVDQQADPVMQGRQMLESLVESLAQRAKSSLSSRPGASKASYLCCESLWKMPTSVPTLVGPNSQRDGRKAMASVAGSDF